MKVLLAIIIILILLVIGIYCNTLFRGRSLIWTVYRRGKAVKSSRKGNGSQHR